MCSCFVVLVMCKFDCTYNLCKQFIVVTRDRHHIYKLFSCAIVLVLLSAVNYKLCSDDITVIVSPS